MKKFIFIIIILFILFITSCAMEVIPNREFITIEDCLYEEVQERGPWDREIYFEEWQVKIAWEITELKEENNINGDIYYKEYYYILILNDNIRRYDLDYGWNIQYGPEKWTAPGVYE